MDITTFFRRMFICLHQFGAARKLAKAIFRGVPKSQKFHGGLIYCDMVEHSWAWVHGPRYEQHDLELQDALLHASVNTEVLVDIGCNVGAMALSVLLRNPAIETVCIDPNPGALKLLRISLARNGLASRTKVICAAVGSSSANVRFDFDGSVTGHVSNCGVIVPTIRLPEILSGLLPHKKTLLKIDTEGYETYILPTLAEVGDKTALTLFVELHPLGMNAAGNPSFCYEILRRLGARIHDLGGNDLKFVNDEAFTQVVARW